MVCFFSNEHVQLFAHEYKLIDTNDKILRIRSKCLIYVRLIYTKITLIWALTSKVSTKTVLVTNGRNGVGNLTWSTLRKFSRNRSMFRASKRRSIWKKYIYISFHKREERRKKRFKKRTVWLFQPVWSWASQTHPQPRKDWATAGRAGSAGASCPSSSAEGPSPPASSHLGGSPGTHQ